MHGIAIAFLSAGACQRVGPPAPVDDRTGAYARTAPPPSRQTEHVAVPIQSSPIMSAPIASGPISSAPIEAPITPAATVSSPQPAPAVATPSGPAEVTVQVAPGQTLYAIAREHNVPVRALIDVNELDPPYALRAGQRIKVPMLPTHLVADGDTLTTVARRYGVGVRALAETNHLEPPYRIIPGTRLLIPRAIDEPSVASAAPVAPASNPDHVLRLPEGMEAAPRRDPAGPPAETAALGPLPPPPVAAPAHNLPGGRGFVWPVHGDIASPFGPKPGGTQNDGVNIVARRGTAVHAAADGVVVYAGNELRGYGNLLLIRHAGGWMTAYAHNDELLVRRGAHVKRGQVISKVGGTGGVSSPQLHFELRQSGRPIDPISVMGPLS
jgi:murein DD-endopeptidase MepM/ murein hydrolase activator NlpD